MTISQRKVRARRLPGKVGQHYDISALNEEVDFTNAYPQATQITTITVTGAVDSTDYAYQVDGVEVTANSGVGATTTTIAAALAEAHNANPLVRGQVVASSAAAVLTLESTYPGLEFTVTENDANLDAPSTTQSAATAEAIPFGVLCIRGADSELDPYGNRLGRIASSSGLTAQSVTLTHGEVSGALVTLRIDGTLYEGSGANAAALVASINGAVPAESVTAAAVGAAVTITVDTAGDQFELVAYSGDIGLTSQEAGDVVDDIALGVSLYTYDEEANLDGEIGYPANAGAVALRRGRVWVESDVAVSESDPVYVQLTGDNAGELYKTRAAGRARLTRARWYKSRSDDGLAVLGCDFR